MEASVNSDTIARGDYLLAHGCAFRVTNKTRASLTLYCVNGDWEGRYDCTNGHVQVAGMTETWPMKIERHAVGSQVPTDMHYNELIPWLTENGHDL